MLNVCITNLLQRSREKYMNSFSFSDSKSFCQVVASHSDIYHVMNKTAECIWHPVIWPCCPLLPLMILRYKCTHVGVLPGLHCGCMLFSSEIQNSVYKTCLFVKALWGFMCFYVCVSVSLCVST